MTFESLDPQDARRKAVAWVMYRIYLICQNLKGHRVAAHYTATTRWDPVTRQGIFQFPVRYWKGGPEERNLWWMLQRQAQDLMAPKLARLGWTLEEPSLGPRNLRFWIDPKGGRWHVWVDLKAQDERI